MSTIKVLVSGDPQGKLGALFKRVAAVNKSNGPFDYLFCVGSFFPPSGPEGDAEDPDVELLEYVTRNRDVPVPTYFIGGFGRGSEAALAALEGTADSKLHYLGAAGVAKLRGLNVAFLDGLQPPPGGAGSAGDPGRQHGCRFHSQADVDRLTREVESAEGDIDLLLTCEWPADVAGGLAASAIPAGVDAGGSDVVARLAVSVRPRYHFCGSKGVFWARAPYMNKDLGAGAHATRFVGLAAVGNTDKQKSLHALGLVPAAAMLDRSALTAKPADATPSPYEAAAARRKRSAGETHDEQLGVQDWRWQDRKRGRQHAPPSLGRPGVVKNDELSVYVRNLPFHATEADLETFFCQAGPVADVRRGANAEGKLNGFGHIQFDDEQAVQRALALHGTELMGREIFVDAASNRPGPPPLPAGKPVEGCWFCLSNPNADVELVASVGEESYVAVDKGAIDDGHVLVLPIEHFPNSLGVPPGTHAEMERYLSALQSCYAAQGKEAVAFERFMAFRKSGGNHCHINVVPVPALAAATARATFDRAAAAIGASFTELSNSSGEAARKALRDAVGEAEFMRVMLPGGTQLVHPIPRGERFPLNFGREVAAAIAGVPDRADWKKCAVSPAEETARTERFKAAFKQHDIMQ